MAKVVVTLKKSVLDPQGVAVRNALASMGYGSIADVRMGKYLEVRVAGSDAQKAEKEIREICEKLLANPVIEEYKFEMVKD